MFFMDVSFHIIYYLLVCICFEYFPFLFFFFNDTATTEIYTLSHTTLFRSPLRGSQPGVGHGHLSGQSRVVGDRKSTRLNSSHPSISYAVFCLKKKTY